MPGDVLHEVHTASSRICSTLQPVRNVRLAGLSALVSATNNIAAIKNNKSIICATLLLLVLLY